MTTIIHTTPAPVLTTSPTPHHHNPRTSTHTRNLDPFHLHINRTITAYNHALANDPNFDGPPLLIPDSDKDDDDLDYVDIVSPIIPPAEDTHTTVESSLTQPIPPPTLPPLTDDEQNQLQRPSPFGLSH